MDEHVDAAMLYFLAYYTTSDDMSNIIAASKITDSPYKTSVCPTIKRYENFVHVRGINPHMV